MGKPVFVFVPGAWHGPEAFESVGAILKKAGYDSAYISLKSVGASTPLTGYEPDVEVVRETTQKLLDDGKDVVIVMHSYGGAPGQQAAGLLKESKGKLIRLVWLCAFVFQGGQSLIKMLGGNPLPWFQIKNDGKEVDPGTPEAVFYNDLSAQEAAKWVAKLKTHSYRTLFSEVSNESWLNVPSAYLVCEDDQAIPVQAQEGMVAAAQGRNPKAFDIVEKIATSHSPFLSEPETVAKFLEKCAA